MQPWSMRVGPCRTNDSHRTQPLWASDATSRAESEERRAKSDNIRPMRMMTTNVRQDQHGDRLCATQHRVDADDALVDLLTTARQYARRVSPRVDLSVRTSCWLRASPERGRCIRQRLATPTATPPSAAISVMGMFKAPPVSVLMATATTIGMMANDKQS